MWSFGVCMWEIFSYGNVPYDNFSNRDTVQYINSGYRLEKPENTPDDVYEIMSNCWKNNPEERPSFSDIYQTLDKIWRPLLKYERPPKIVQ